MSLKKMIMPLFCGGLLAASFMINASASSVTPGGADDPVVTKSYVDKLINELKGSGSGGELSEYQMEFIINEITANLAETGVNTGSATSASAVYTPVSLKTGQVLIGEEGTEIILRSGSALGYTIGSDGLVNATTGTDLGNNGEIGRNNLLIVPRADGRGVRATSDIWLLVKGGYNILY